MLSVLQVYYGSRSIADRFDVSISTAWETVHKICKKLLKINVKYKIIAWPDNNQITVIKEGFFRKNSFPG